MSAVPAIQEQMRRERPQNVDRAERPSTKGHGLSMAACCAVMAAGFAIFAFSAPFGQPITTTPLSAAPLAGCLAMHFAMHRFLGKSCHSSNNSRKTRP